jgi:hypothetical protein
VTSRSPGKLAKLPRHGPRGACRLVVSPPQGKQAADEVLKRRKGARVRYDPTAGLVIILCPPLS